MLKVYGTMLCKDCVALVEKYTENKVNYEFVDITGTIEAFKEFIQLRDAQTELFADVKKEGGIGIPCVMKEDGSYTLNWEEMLA